VLVGDMISKLLQSKVVALQHKMLIYLKKNSEINDAFTIAFSLFARVQQFCWIFLAAVVPELQLEGEKTSSHSETCLQRCKVHRYQTKFLVNQ
jgi:hypothetical protein